MLNDKVINMLDKKSEKNNVEFLFKQLLPQSILNAIRSRAGKYDNDNSFCVEDIAELTQCNYTTFWVQKSSKAGRISFLDICLNQNKLAKYSPPTALAINMHMYWAVLFQEAIRNGFAEFGRLLDKMEQGEIFAAGHGEPGNNSGVLDSGCSISQGNGKTLNLSGKKIFTSLSPCWDQLGVHAKDSSGNVLHLFIPRGLSGISSEDNWDCIGMRATASQNTILKDVAASKEHVYWKSKAGEIDYFNSQIITIAQSLFSSVYLGCAMRAFEIVQVEAKANTQKFESHAQDYAEIYKMLEKLKGYYYHCVKKINENLEHNPFKNEAVRNQNLVDAITLKQNVTENSWLIVDKAFDLIGGKAAMMSHEMQRIWRDCKMGLIQPLNKTKASQIISQLTFK